MSRQAIIEKIIQAMNQLPDDKVEEIFDFADFIARKYENDVITKGIGVIASKSEAYDFLRHEDEIYTLADIKETYNGKG